MRPSDPAIPIPPWPEGTRWIGGPVAAAEAVSSKAPLLVHFFDAAQLNSIRSAPYIAELADRYQPHGLRVFGIHTPRWPLTEDPEAASRAIGRMALPYPVALDSSRRIWTDYGCHGWPHSFVWRQGGILAWSQLGEGAYEELESILREVIEEAGSAPVDGWPDPIEPIRPTDRTGARLIAPSEEMLVGGSLENPWSTGDGGTAIEASYRGEAAFASIGGAGRIGVQSDGGDFEELLVEGPELVELAAHEEIGDHTIVISPEPGIEIYSLSFTPGLAES